MKQKTLLKTIASFVIFLLFIFTLQSCTVVQPGPGQEAVLTEKPIMFGHGGVVEQPISTGLSYTWFSTSKEYYDITPQKITEDFENLIPSDNTPVSFSVYLKLKAQSGKTPILCKGFGGSKWYENNIQAAFRTMVRDKASAYTMFDLASKREISMKLEKDLTETVSTYIKNLGIPVDVLQVSIGTITPPETVLNQTKLTAEQNQGKLTQIARADAELSRKQAEINKAIADKAYQQSMGMTVDQYLHLRTIEIEKEKVELIKENKNVSIIFGSVGVNTQLK